MKHKLLSHTQGECYREIGDGETPDVCVDCAMLKKAVEQFYMDTNRVEQLPDFAEWIRRRTIYPTPDLKHKVAAIIHFVRKVGFTSIKAKRDTNKVWHVHLYMKHVRFNGDGADFEKAYDDALAGFFNLLCGIKDKKKTQQPSVSM